MWGECKDPGCPYKEEVERLEQDIYVLKDLKKEMILPDRQLIDAALDVVKVGDMLKFEKRGDVEFARLLSALRGVLASRGYRPRR